MSSWCHDPRGCFLAMSLLVVGGSAEAAQVYYQPKAEVATEVDTNRNLVSDGSKQTSEGYAAEVGGLFGIGTPTSDTTIRPDVRFTDYAKAKEHELHGLLDFSSQYRAQRWGGNLSGRFDRDATYGSELPNAQFNPVNPNLPTTPETGRISTDTTRTVTTLVPAYGYDLTPRLRWDLTGTFQRVDYSGTSASNYIPYSYYLAGTGATWAYNPRMDVSVSVFGSHESAKDDSGTVKARGGRLGLNFKWSKQFSGHLELTVERDDSKLIKPVVVDKSSTGVGLTFVTSWKGEVSKFQLSTGRTYTPSGAGGTFRADQLQAEYHRDLTQRLALSAGGRFVRYQSESGTDRGNNYDYVNAFAGLKWAATRTWYVSGGIEYLRRKIVPPIGTANNGMVYVAFGYQGLGRPH
jgi:hypothetical protein